MSNILAEARDKKRDKIKIAKYELGLRDQVFALFREGYPDSFDEYDLEFIEEFLNDFDEDGNQRCLLAIVQEEIVGASLMEKVAGPQDLWETSYIFTRVNLQNRGIGRILIAVQEECLKDEARVSFAINPGILPKNVISYPFWINVGYKSWGILPGYFRDDLSGIFLVKRNPHYRIGRGISKDSGWVSEMADSQTGKRISRKEYQEILHSLELTPKEKWGLDLIDRENVLIRKI